MAYIIWWQCITKLLNEWIYVGEDKNLFSLEYLVNKFLGGGETWAGFEGMSKLFIWAGSSGKESKRKSSVSWGRMFLISKLFLEKAHFCYSEVYHLSWNGGVIIRWWNHRPDNLLKIVMLERKLEVVHIPIFDAWKLTFLWHICFLKCHLFAVRHYGYLLKHLISLDFIQNCRNKLQDDVYWEVLRNSENLRSWHLVLSFHGK